MNKTKKDKIESIIIILLFYLILVGSVILLNARFQQLESTEYNNSSSSQIARN